jgi:hypothetical protein
MPEVAAALADAARAAWTRAATPGPPTLAVATRPVALPAPGVSLRNCLRGWAPRGLALPLDGAFPREAALTAVALGDAAWVAFPGELQTALGQGIKAAARPRFAHAFVAGLSNDYLGYFVTAADFDRPVYVTCATVYGPAAGRCLADVAADLVRALGRGERPPPTRAACDGTGR